MFAGNLHVKTLQDLVLYRVIPRYPKLTYKLFSQTGLWVEDPKFHITNHVFSVSYSNLEVSVPFFSKYVSEIIFLLFINKAH